MDITLLKAAIFRHWVGILGINLPRHGVFLFICDLKREYQAVTSFSLLKLQAEDIEAKLSKCKRQGCLYA